MYVLALVLLLLAPQGVQIPAPTGYVNDFANVIASEQRSLIERIIDDVRAKSKGEIVLVTLPSIGDRDVSEVALRIGREWKVGKLGNPADQTRNTGAVILLVPKETNADGRGRCWVTTGSGTEGFITDAESGEMCREATPYFQRQDYSTGMELVAFRVAQHYAHEFNFELDTASAPIVSEPVYGPLQRSPGGGGISPQTLFIIFIVVMFLLSSMGGRRRRRGGCGGGGCMPIFLPFGGGGFGGRGGGWGGGGGFGGGGGGGFGGFGGGGGFSGGGGGSSW
jgi:uncharacterized protein